MAKVDIFALPIEWSDDAREATYPDLDGTMVTYTIDRVARQINNVMSNHHPACGVDDCEMVEHPESALARDMAKTMGIQHQHEPVMVGRCYVEGPMTPEMREKREAPPPPFPATADRSVGFDITRQSDAQSPYASE